jgi:hypothetical protein
VVTAWEPLFFLFYPFPGSRGTQIHECCIKFRNDFIMRSTLCSVKIESESGSAPRRGCNQASMSGSSVGHTPSRPRGPRYSRACPAASCNLVIMKLIQRRRDVYYCKKHGWIFLRCFIFSAFLGGRIVDFSGEDEMIEGKLRLVHLLLVSS